MVGLVGTTLNLTGVDQFNNEENEGKTTNLLNLIQEEKDIRVQ